MTAICPRCGLTAECDDREDALGWLRAHWDERHDPERIIRARVPAVVLALLPLHDAWPDDEPADLIEWAERLS